MNKILLSLVSAATLAALTATAQAQVVTATPPAVKLGSGFDYSRGDYGFTAKTEVFSVPANLSYEEDQWLFRVIVPYLTIKGPASVVAGGAAARPTSRSESGIGDTTLSATYHARPDPGGLNVDVTGRVKLATADDAKGLGTGQTDYYAQVDIYQAFTTFIPFANVGYRWLGRSTQYPLKNGLYASAGSSMRVSTTTIVGASFDWRSSIINGAKDATDVTIFVGANPDPRWTVTAYFLKGLNDASPDYGLGALIAYKF